MNIEFSNVGQENVTQVSAEREHEAVDIFIQLQKVPLLILWSSNAIPPVFLLDAIQMVA